MLFDVKLVWVYTFVLNLDAICPLPFKHAARQLNFSYMQARSIDKMVTEEKSS